MTYVLLALWSLSLVLDLWISAAEIFATSSSDHCMERRFSSSETFWRGLPPPPTISRIASVHAGFGDGKCAKCVVSLCFQ